jgi:hypothetical protein
VLGLAIFAFAYVVTIPSWVNEKRHSVNVNKAVWAPATLGLVMKVGCAQRISCVVHPVFFLGYP